MSESSGGLAACIVSAVGQVSKAERGSGPATPKYAELDIDHFELQALEIQHTWEGLSDLPLSA